MKAFFSNTVIKRLLSVFCFVTLVCSVIVGLSFGASSDVDFGCSVSNTFMLEQENSVDVVFIGGSAIYRYVCSPQLWGEHGFTSYVYGTAAQPFEAAISIIKETRRTQDPQLYVIEVRTLINYSRMLNAGTPLGTDTTDMYYTQIVLDNLSHISTRIDFLRRMGSRLTFSDASDWFVDTINEPNFDLTNSNIRALKGSKSATKYEDMTDYYFDTTGFENEFTTNCDYSIQLLDELCEYAVNHDVNLLFVTTPWPENEETISLENDIGQRIREKGYSYINCNYYYEEIGIDFGKDFYNDTHVNAYGAVDTTAFLGDYISENCNIVKNHDAGTIEDWNNTYKDWQELIKKQYAGIDKLIKAAKES